MLDKIGNMKLILIRHGESAKNSGKEVADNENFLTIKGVKQAVVTASLLADKKIDVIYCSPAKRCEQTLDEILRIRSDNFPIHMTQLVGPKLKSETYERLKLRVEMFLDDLKYDHEKEETVMVISHQLPLSMMNYCIKKCDKKFENGEIVEMEI